MVSQSTVVPSLQLVSISPYLENSFRIETWLTEFRLQPIYRKSKLLFPSQLSSHHLPTLIQLTISPTLVPLIISPPWFHSSSPHPGSTQHLPTLVPLIISPPSFHSSSPHSGSSHHLPTLVPLIISQCFFCCSLLDLLFFGLISWPSNADFKFKYNNKIFRHLGIII